MSEPDTKRVRFPIFISQNEARGNPPDLLTLRAYRLTS